jgi:hypothetical protein
VQNLRGFHPPALERLYRVLPLYFMQEQRNFRPTFEKTRDPTWVRSPQSYHSQTSRETGRIFFRALKKFQAELLTTADSGVSQYVLIFVLPQRGFPWNGGDVRK